MNEKKKKQFLNKRDKELNENSWQRLLSVGHVRVLTSGHSHQLCHTEDARFDEAVFQVDCRDRRGQGAVQSSRLHSVSNQ